jgi:chromosome condensin MukBEF complex kleisin-like MukF subunit
MSVYVDSHAGKLGRMVMCHMIADTQAELHAMALSIGMKREWFQEPPKASAPHYDVSKGRRAQAVRLGAVEVDRHGLVAKIQELRTKGWP